MFQASPIIKKSITRMLKTGLYLITAIAKNTIMKDLNMCQASERYFVKGIKLMDDEIGLHQTF